MARFLVLIYEDEQKWDEAGEVVQAQNHADHATFMDKVGAARIGGQALQSATTAVTIRRTSSGRATLTDGPFAETKETLGGFYLLEAADRDEAVSMAELLPSYFGGGIEVRPVQEFS